MKIVKGLTLSYFIKRAYENYGFVSAFIYGFQGVGKTTYGLKVLHGIYNDWDMVLDNTYFYIDNLLPKLKESYKSGERIKAILLDDAGVWLTKYYWYRHFSVWFSKFFNLIRTVSAGLLFTSVEVTDIVKFVRDKMVYRVAIIPENRLWRKAIGYKVVLLPSLDRIVVRYFADRFTLKLPSDVRKQYEEMRKEALEKLMSEIERKKQPPKPPAIKLDALIREL